MDSTENARELLGNTVITDVTTATQFMIHRIPENTTQLLGSELLQPHNGLVDLAAGDFIPVGYTSEDLLTQDLTEEDRNLAAALVAVQLSQQQKQQHMHDGILPPIDTNSSLASKTLQEQNEILHEKEDGASGLNSGFIHIVGSENIYIEKHVGLPKTENIRYANSAHTEHQFNTLEEKNTKRLLSIKTEEDKRDSDGESLRNDNKTSKKSLPHKKRISRKLKKNNNSFTSVKKIVCNLCEQTFTSNDDFAQHEILCQTTITPIHPTVFNCQLCDASFQDQLRFFEHLKKHYEPGNANTVQEKPAIEPIDSERHDTLLSSLLNLTCIACNKTFRRQKMYEVHMRDVHTPKTDHLDEFSEPEDLMEGINVVVGPDPHSDIEEDSKAWYHEDDLQQTEEDLKELEADNGHVCHLCKQPFPLRALLLQHLINCRVATGNTGARPHKVENGCLIGEIDRGRESSRTMHFGTV